MIRTEFYTRQDIEDILRAVDKANKAGANDDSYRAGFVAALEAVGLAFGIQPGGKLLFMVADDRRAQQ